MRVDPECRLRMTTVTADPEDPQFQNKDFTVTPSDRHTAICALESQGPPSGDSDI